MSSASEISPKQRFRFQSYLRGAILLLLIFGSAMLYFTHRSYTAWQHNTLAESEYRKLLSTLRSLARKRTLPDQFVFSGTGNDTLALQQYSIKTVPELELQIFYLLHETQNEVPLQLLFLDVKHRSESEVYRYRSVNHKELHVIETRSKGSSL